MKKRIPAAQAFNRQQTNQPESDDYGELAAAKSLPSPNEQLPTSKLITSEELQLEKEPIKVRETGFWRWKRVIVPPNAYVVHTRMGRDAPMTLGLGKSFRYNPETDAYLLVPAAMQTIGIVAKSITQEKQGINILAYLQWQINDFSIAYKKLDFSDSRDPLGIVNAQLGEQAEATIKDKIATMSVEDVLTDKAPIIEELTKRLEAVTEGAGATQQEGLGIKIVTVQIREALVSSQKLWQDLQAPFRHQQEKMARISQLTMQNEVQQKELESRQLRETREAETLAAIEHVKHESQLAALQNTHESILEKAKLENEANNNQKTLQTEQALHATTEESRLNDAKMQAEQQRLEQETILKKQAAEFNLVIQEQDDLLEAKALEARLTRQRQTHQAEMALEEASHQLKMAQREKEVEIARMEQENRNLINESDLLRRFIDKSVDIAAEMPDIQELKVLQTGNETFDAFSAFVAKMLAVAESLGIPLKK